MLAWNKRQRKRASETASTKSEEPKGNERSRVEVREQKRIKEFTPKYKLIYCIANWPLRNEGVGFKTKPNHEEIENLNSFITSKEIESLIKTSQQRKVQDQMASLVNSTKHLKKN